MLETNLVNLGNKQIYQLKNIREIHELLRNIKHKYDFIYPEKSYNDLLFDEMLKRDTYIVPIFYSAIPVLIYMCYYHNNPCVFIISLQSLDTIYVLPLMINIEYKNILLYGEIRTIDNTIINFERIIYYNDKLINNIKYNKQIDLINKCYKILNVEWILPKPIYHITEIEKMVSSCNNMIGMRFYSFKNPVVFYKNITDLGKRIIIPKDIKLLENIKYWNNSNNNTETNNNTEINNNIILTNINYDIINNLYISILNYGIYRVYNSENKDLGILRLRTFEEHNELFGYLNKYKTIEMKLKYDKYFNKWTISNKTIKDSIVKAY
jgi:hypothetical protein